jgi:hypothetical protein
MKAALATLAVILSSLAASAQIVDQVGNQTVSRTFFLPCANGGQGDTVVFTGVNVRTILHSAFDANGHINGDGFFMWADDLKGKGAVRRYEADGSELDTWTGATDPDGIPSDLDGTFTFTSNYHITTRHKGRHSENIMFQYVQQFTVFNNGNNLTEPPTVTVCK